MALLSVLKYEGDNTTFVWKHPNVDFKTGSQLIVHESQTAIFMANGEVLDTFGPGAHTLETEYAPVTKGLFKLATGGRNAFHAELYFVNLTTQMAIRWGTDSKIQYMDPEYHFPLEIGACGEMILTVSNAQKLLVKVVGTEKNLTREQLTAYFRAFIMNRVKSAIPAIIAEYKINIFNIDQYLTIISEKIEKILQDDFYDYGVDLKRFLITTVLKPDDDRNYVKFKELHYRQFTDVAEAELQQKIAVIEQETKARKTVIEAESIAKKRELEGYTYQQEKGFEVAKEMARNEAIGEYSNLGIGLGMMAGVGSGVGQQVGAMTNGLMDAATVPVKSQAATGKKYCTNCGHELLASARFCEMCGTKAERADICSSCGYVFTNEAKFCPECGTKRG